MFIDKLWFYSGGEEKTTYVSSCTVLQSQHKREGIPSDYWVSAQTGVEGLSGVKQSIIESRERARGKVLDARSADALHKPLVRAAGTWGYAPWSPCM